MAPSNPQSPQDQIMDFISTLGEHMEEAMSAASPQTEKGEATDKDVAGDPPEYFPTEKGEPSTSAHGHRGPGDRHEHHGGRRGRGGWGGPWNRDWRNSEQGEQGQNPWAAMANMFNPENFQGTHPFFGGPGGPHRGGRGGFGFGGRGGPHMGGPWGWGGHHGGRRSWGGRGHCHNKNDQEFNPKVDLFDTPDSFVVHVALAGALKEDIGINYDFDNAELQIAGVVHRPGDEEFLKHLVDGERRVGAFDRKVKLESNGKSVPVDADAITAKLENGLLEVTVPKLRKSDEPEKKKITIE